MRKVMPRLWLDGNVEEAANFCVSLFKNARGGKITRYDDASTSALGRPAGTALTVERKTVTSQALLRCSGPFARLWRKQQVPI